MSKRKYRDASHLAYNRPSKGYKKNLARGLLKETELPSARDNKKLLRNLMIALAVWAVLTIWAVIVRGLKGFIVWLVIGLMCSFFVLLYVNSLDKKYIRAYKELGISKERFLEELAKTRKLDEKQLKRLSRLWDRTKTE